MEEKNKPLLTTCAVGDFYINEVLEFLNTEFSKDFNIHVLTDKPHMFKNVTVDLYEKTTFNYFDKFIYGIGKLQKLSSAGFIYDADVLKWFKGDYKIFNQNSNYIQFFNYWQGAETLDILNEEGKSFLNFFRLILQQENIQEKDIVLVHEDKMFFPKQDYTEFLLFFNKLLLPFVENSNRKWGHKGAVGNGEGAALGYALHKAELQHRLIKYSST